MTQLGLFLLLVQAVLLSHSGWASVAVVRQALVEQHAILTDARLTTFLALSQITPGPLGFYLLFVGYSVQGWIGALSAWLALVLPSFLVLPIMRLVERRQHVEWFRGATVGVVVGSAALMLSTAVTLAKTVAPTPPLMVVALVAMLLLTVGRVPSFAVVVLAALAGLLPL